MTWREDADACALVYRETGAAPRERSSDPEEVRLARWLVRQRRDFRGGIPYFTEERRAYLDEVYPDWNDDPDDTWLKHALAVVAIVAETGRYPLSNSDDEREKFLGFWLVYQRRFLRSGAKRLTPERIEKLNELLPGWDDAHGLRKKSDDAAWRAGARRYAEFVRINRRPPIDSRNREERLFHPGCGSSEAPKRRGRTSSSLRGEERSWTICSPAGGAPERYERTSRAGR